MKINQKLIYLLISIIAISCDNFDSRLKIYNKSDKPIAVEFSEDTIPIGLNKVEFFLNNLIYPDSIMEFNKKGRKNEWSIFISLSKNQKLNAFVFDIDTLKKYNDMKYIRQNNLYLKRYSLSEDYLNKVNWVITYP